MYSNKKRSKNTGKKKVLIGSAIVLAICLFLFGLAVAHVINLPWQHNNTDNISGVDSSGASNSNKSNDKPSKDLTNNTSGSNNNNDKVATGGNNTGEPSLSNVPIKKPYGTFVSNHTPGQNGAPNTINSVCDTTAGITCTITFTKAGVTKSLGTKRTNRDGTVHWDNWTPESIGLTSGSWTIEAIAKSGSKQASAQDNILLEIK